MFSFFCALTQNLGLPTIRQNTRKNDFPKIGYNDVDKILLNCIVQGSKQNAHSPKTGNCELSVKIPKYRACYC